MVAEESGFKAAIVGRDATSSALMTRALTSNLGCAATSVRASNLLRVIASTKIDIAIISADIGLKAGAGFDLASQVSQAYPTLPILILIGEPANDSTIRAFRSGARGVFNHTMPMSQFLDSVNHVRKGYIWAGPQEAAFLLGSVRGIPVQRAADSAVFASLTDRELEVVQSAASGKTNKAIAAELMLSENMVKSCMSRAFEKLGVSSRLELPSSLKSHSHPPLKQADHKPSVEAMIQK